MTRDEAFPPTGWLAYAIFTALAVVLAVPGAQALPNTRLAGRFSVVPAAPPANGLSTDVTVDIDPRASTYTVSIRPDLGEALRGLGLSEGTDLVGFSLYTGGIAHGLAVYRKTDGGQRWQGRWVSSIDSGSNVGTMEFDADPKQPTLAGRHHFSGHRAASGEFDGTVTMNPQGEDFVLTYTTAGGAVLYRGVGIVRGERLVVAWSFGSSPALAVYQLTARGGLDSRRVSLRSGGLSQPLVEHLFPAGVDPVAAGVEPPDTGAEPAPKRGDTPANDLSASEPGAPVVKTSVYLDLMTRYGTEGWAERWLDRQLTVDEFHLLQRAARRHRAGAPTTDLGSRTVAQLIDEERALQSR